MIKLIKKGGLRERANRSQKYSHSENNITTLDPHRYAITEHPQVENAQAQIEESVAQIDLNHGNIEIKSSKD